MACSACTNNPYHNQLCEGCFIGLLERRIRKMLRSTGGVQKNDTLLIQDPFCEAVIRSIAPGLPFTVASSGHGKTVLSWTMDDEIEQFLDCLFLNKPIPHGNNPAIIKLFLCLTDREYEAYARAKHTEPREIPSRKYAAFLDEFEKRHQETRYTLLKTIGELNSILHQKIVTSK